ncbi:MAG: DUF5117 domain-containing protein, partial [Pricia sp.]|nr:DUF5117 domain-containing protein [Pricia sp.]
MKRLFFLLAIVILATSCSTLGLVGKSDKKGNSENLALNSSKTYDRIITNEAITQQGLFDVHRVGDKYYFELTENLLNREVLVVTRFIKTPSGAGNYGGEKISENTIVFEKGPADNIFLRISTLVSAANEDDAIAKAVNNSNITPILEAFDIKAVNEQKKSYLIDVTDFINGENPLLALSPDKKDDYKLLSLEKN